MLLGNGNGTFQPNRDFGVGASPLSLVVGDFNADGTADVACANFVGNSVTVLLGNVNGTLQATQDFGSSGASPPSLAQGDFNGDGKADFAVASQITPDVSVLLHR